MDKERASLWQRAEMLAGSADELNRLVRRLSNRLRYGAEEIPAAEAQTTRPAREGLHGSLEDTYDEFSAVRDQLGMLLQEIGTRGEGPRGELNTARPHEYAEDPTAAKRQASRW